MRFLAAVYIGSLLITTVFSQFHISDFTYQGCYQDQSRRNLRAEYIVYPYMTQELCLSYCKRRAYKYAGLQNGNACFCGDETQLDGDRKPESECNVKCPGEIMATCGGVWRNAIYSTGAEPHINEYIGCYIDKADRQMKGYFAIIGNMSTRACIYRCRSLFFKYAGLQNGNARFCGNEEPNCWEQVNENECSANCSLDYTTKCGGTWRNSVYKTLLPWDSSYVYVYTDYTYLGCYLDSAQRRRLRGEFTTFTYITQEMCLSFCKKRSFKYAGLQYGRLCSCGDETPLPIDLRPESECNSNCPGEQGTNCGGLSRNAVYSTGKEPPKYGYVGCYLDVEGYRKLKGFYIRRDQMTRKNCIGQCRREGYKYAGLQAGVHCFCGNDVPLIADGRNENECSTVCPGDYTSMCGGGLRNSIYQTSEIQ